MPRTKRATSPSSENKAKNTTKRGKGGDKKEAVGLSEKISLKIGKFVHSKLTLKSFLSDSIFFRSAPDSLDRVLKAVRLLRKTESEKSRNGKLTLEELGIDNVGREVIELTDDQVLETIESVFLEAARQILNKNGLNYVIPSRANSNQLYVSELDRIVLKNAMTNRSLANVGTVRKTAITTRILQLVHEVVGRHIHITKRDLFYTDVKLFEKQTESDNVIDDIACMIGCTRNSLNGRPRIGNREGERER